MADPLVGITFGLLNIIPLWNKKTQVFGSHLLKKHLWILHKSAYAFHFYSWSWYWKDGAIKKEVPRGLYSVKLLQHLTCGRRLNTNGLFKTVLTTERQTLPSEKVACLKVFSDVSRVGIALQLHNCW